MSRMVQLHCLIKYKDNFTFYPSVFRLEYRQTGEKSHSCRGIVCSDLEANETEREGIKESADMRIKTGHSFHVQYCYSLCSYKL
jgi:hypothetical protein